MITLHNAMLTGGACNAGARDRVWHVVVKGSTEGVVAGAAMWSSNVEQQAQGSGAAG